MNSSRRFGGTTGTITAVDVVDVFVRFSCAANVHSMGMNLTTPAARFILTKPGSNALNDLPHSRRSTFNGGANPQYLTMLTWIQQGAANNQRRVSGGRRPPIPGPQPIST